MSAQLFVPPWYESFPAGFAPYFDSAVTGTPWTVLGVTGSFRTLAEGYNAWLSSGQPAFAAAGFLNAEDDLVAYGNAGGMNKHGNTELAYASCKSGITQAMVASTPAVLTDLSMEVPPCKRPVRIDYSVATQVTTVGAGGLYGLLYEITTGTPVQLASTGVPFSLGGTWSKYGGVSGWYPVGPSDIWRSFVLYVALYQDAAAGAASVRNAAGGLGAESLMRATA